MTRAHELALRKSRFRGRPRLRILSSSILKCHFKVPQGYSSPFPFQTLKTTLVQF